MRGERAIGRSRRPAAIRSPCAKAILRGGHACGPGFSASDVGFNALERTERTHLDARLDGIDDFCALFLIAGTAMLSQNDRIVKMAAGNVILKDMSRPFVARFGGEAHWLDLNLPRQTLISHLGFAPIGGQLAQGGTKAGRLLFEVAISALHGEERRRSSLGTAQPLSAIAEACGFSNPTVFGRKFHRRFGSRPRDYTAPLADAASTSEA